MHDQRMVGWPAFERKQSADCRHVAGIGAEAIDRLGRESNQPTRPQALDGSGYLSGVGIEVRAHRAILPQSRTMNAPAHDVRPCRTSRYNAALTDYPLYSSPYAQDPSSCACSARWLAAFVVTVTSYSWVSAEITGLNGEWVIDESNSENFEDAGRAFNEAKNEHKRRKEAQEFNRNSTAGGGNKFQNSANATEEFIREDSRSKAWSVPDELEPMIEAARLKIYVSGKVIVLYGSERKRLLAINPSGRAYSVRGTEFTDDVIGRSLTYIDDAALVVETDLRSGSKLVERYAAGETADTLIETVRIQQDGRGPWLQFQTTIQTPQCQSMTSRAVSPSPQLPQ